MTNETIYEKHGYIDRRDYLEHQSDIYGIPLGEVYMIAEVLGPDEDFDGLVNALEDYLFMGF